MEITLKHDLLTVRKVSGAELQRFIQTALTKPYPLFRAEKWEAGSLHLIQVTDKLDDFDQDDVDVFVGLKKRSVETYPTLKALLCYLAQENLIHVGYYLVSV